MREELPAGWAWTTLGALGRYVNGRGFKKSEWSETGRPIIRIQNLTGFGAAFNCYAGELEERYIVRPGDLLISWAATLGAYIWKGPEGALNQHIFKVESDIDKAFHRYLIDYKLADLMRHAHGSGMVHITRGKFDNLAVALPPLAEQRRIVEALEDHLSRLDAGELLLRNSRSRFQLLSRAVSTAAVEGQLTARSRDPEGRATDFVSERKKAWVMSRDGDRYKEPALPDLTIPPALPDGWSMWSLEAVTHPARTIRYGILMPKVENGEVPYVEVKDLIGNSLAGKQLHKTSRALDEKFAAARVTAGDVVLAVRGSYDRSALVPASMTGANVSRDVVRLAPLEGLLPEYLQIYLQSSFAQQYLARHARGVAVKGVNIASLRMMPVVIPPILEQRAIIETVRAQLQGLNILQVALNKARTRAPHLRRAVLASAFRGKLVAQDPADEPASELLARIKAERASLAAGKAKPVRRARKTATTARAPKETTTVPSGVQEELPL